MDFDLFKKSDHSIKLLKCNKCCHLTNNCPKHELHYNHCYTCYCSNPGCLEAWYICAKHNKRFARCKMSRLHDHFLGKDHKDDCIDDSVSLNMDTTFTEEPFSLDVNASLLHYSENVLVEDSSHTQSSSKRSKLRHDKAHKENDNDMPESNIHLISKLFFENERVSSGLGRSTIVSQAFRQSNNLGAVANMKETNLHLNITHFCSTLTQTQQSDFASIVSCLVSKDTFCNTRPPMSYNDITKFYTGSQFSIYKNIPSPKVFMMDDHACVSIESIINHMLGFGIKLNSLSLNQKFDQLVSRTNVIENTREAENIINNIKKNDMHQTAESPIIIYIIMWSDDFEANNTRKNRNSTWIKTVTICPPTSHITSPLYTYPISLGRKGNSHDKVNQFFNKEIEKLSIPTLRYSSIHQKLYPVIIRPLCVSADRPERSSINSILSHQGSSTKRWMYSELIPRNKLPSCSKCFHIRTQNILKNKDERKKSSICQKCCDWDMNSDKTTSHFSPPENYPSKKHPESPMPPRGRDICKPFEKIPPICVTYEHLISATNFAFWNYLHSVWTKTQTQIYFRLVGICTSYFTSILELAEQHKKYLPLSKNILNTIPYPAMWTSMLRLEQSIDTPMHLLFQGITKAIIEESKEFLKFHKVWSSFGRQSNLIMDEISRVNINFCKVESFNGGNDYTTGGWIAETYIGFARISCFVYTLVVELLPPVSLALNEFQCMVQSLFCMISRLMTDVEVSKEEMTNYIKLFLSCCQKYHGQLYGNSSTKKPFWNSPNFLSLLNLPTQIDQFGSMRLYWEGVNERYIQYIKPHLKNMRTSTSFLSLKLDDIHKMNILKHHLLQPLSESKSYNRFKDCKQYRDLTTIKDVINNGNTLSGVIYKLNDDIKGIGVLLKHPTKNIIITLQSDDDTGYHLNQMWFSCLCIDQKIEFEQTKTELFVQDFFLAFPLNNFIDNKIRYTIVTKNWQVRKNTGQFDLPMMSKHCIEMLDTYQQSNL